MKTNTKKKPRKSRQHIFVTNKFLATKVYKKNKQKWIVYCEYFLALGYPITMYEALKTVSKYITVYCGNLTFKVRFSDHKPIPSKEARADCDFFVGRTNFTVTNTSEAIIATLDYFKGVKNAAI